MEAMRAMIGGATELDLVKAVLLSGDEWNALAQYCRQRNDLHAMEQVVDLIRRAGTQDPDTAIDNLVSDYANLGDVAQVERLVQKYCGGTRRFVLDVAGY